MERVNSKSPCSDDLNDIGIHINGSGGKIPSSKEAANSNSGHKYSNKNKKQYPHSSSRKNSTTNSKKNIH